MSGPWPRSLRHSDYANVPDLHRLKIPLRIVLDLFRDGFPRPSRQNMRARTPRGGPQPSLRRDLTLLLVLREIDHAGTPRRYHEAWNQR
jgi:hypothetical protein